jgi:WD40 repeat protein
VGQALFAALLGTGEVAGRYRAAEAVGSYVCRRNQLVRHLGVPSAAMPLTVTPPLRILGIVSSPPELAPLDVDKEKEQLTRALAPLYADGLAEVVWAPSANWADLQDMLLGDEWHVVHFTSHGGFDADHGILALTGEDGRMHLVQASRLVDLLCQAHPVPRLVVLNSCSGAATGGTDLFSGTAAALVRGGVTAVAAMQYEPSNPAAIAFSRGFYGAISRGRGVDEAVSSGRVAILGLSDRTLEWVTPVLYLRGHDSHLFTLPAATTSTTKVPVRDTSPSRVVRTLAGRIGRAYDVAFSPDGTLIAYATHAVNTVYTASGYDTLRLWETTSWKQVKVLRGQTASVRVIAFSPDGTLLASAGGDNTVRLWDTGTGKQVGTLKWHTRRGLSAAVLGVAFSPDGTLLAAGGDDKTVRLWQTATGKLVHTLTGYNGSVWSISFSPDGAWLAAAGGGHRIELWDTTTGLSPRRYPRHRPPDFRVAFSLDGTLASASDDGTVRLWG